MFDSKKYMREWAARNIEKARENHRKSDKTQNEKNPEKIRERHRKYRKNNPEKAKAHWTVRHALQDGRLKKGECGFPGPHRGRISAHHSDYSKPLEVIWVCAFHHHTVFHPKKGEANVATR
jgi:hypothetical protein